MLFERKQYLQSSDTESSMQTAISSFTIMSVLMPIKTTRRDYNELLPGFMSQGTEQCRIKGKYVKNNVFLIEALTC